MDTLPELVAYRDTGCSRHPTCLECPFERCRYETPGGVRRAAATARAAEIATLYAGGATVAILSERFRVSYRTVQRALASKTAFR